MCTLYIIGNGFDLAHGLPTSYWNFRKFLESYDLDFLNSFETLYGFPQLDESDPYLAPYVAKWENALYDKLWGALEENMAHMDTSTMLDISSSIVDNLHLDGGNWGIEDTMDVYWQEEYGFIKLLPDYVHKWIESIDLSNIFPRKKSLISKKNARFMTFNYTSTLEECYQIDPEYINHIHGAIDPYGNNPPVLGHGYKSGIFEHRAEAAEAEERFDEGRTSIEHAIADIFEATTKDTDQIIYENRLYFQKMKNIDRVVVIGLSYCEVDIPYLTKVKSSTDSGTHWTMYYHTENDLRKLEKVAKLLDIHETMITLKSTTEFWDVD